MNLTKKFVEKIYFLLEEFKHEVEIRRFQKAIQEGYVTMGAHSYGTPKVMIDKIVGEKVSIGKYCSIAADVSILLGSGHNTQWVTTYPIRIKHKLPGALKDGHPMGKGNVTIGNDVWIGRGSFIMSGVTIGDGAVIAANSMVVKDVAPYSIVGGNPAKFIKNRFSEEQIAALLQIQWWNWPDDKVKQEVGLLCSPDIQAFIDKHLES